MSALSPGRLATLIALAVVVLTAAVILGRAAWNRSGEPTAVLELTERELRPVRPWQDDEDSSLALRLDWTPPAPGPPGCSGERGEWIGRQQLGELGFDVSVEPDSEEAPHHYYPMLPRRAFVALEMDGEAWRRHLRAERRCFEECPERSEHPERCPDAGEIEERMESFRTTRSRLVAVAVAKDARELRQRYPDRGKVAVVPVVVGVSLYRPRELEPGEERTDRGEERPASVTGRLRSLEVDRLHVPLELKRRLEAIAGELPRNPSELKDEGPSFSATITWGRSREPWLEGVGGLETPGEKGDAEMQPTSSLGSDGGGAPPLPLPEVTRTVPTHDRSRLARADPEFR